MNEEVYAAERAVVSAMMQNTKASIQASETLDPSYFAQRDVRLMFRAASALASRGIQPGLIAVTDQLRSAGTLQDAGSEENVSAVYCSGASVSDISYYAAIVKRGFLRRALSQIGAELCERAADLEQEPIATAERAFGLLTALSSDGQVKRDRSMSELIDAIVTEIREHRYDSACDTMIASLDRKLCGLKRGDLIVVAARTTVGKTAFCGDLARRISPAKRTLFITMEMSDSGIAERLLSAHARVSTRDLRNETPSEMVLEAMQSQATKDALEAIRIVEPRKNTPEAVRLKVRSEFSLHGAFDLVVVDHAQQMSEKGHKDRRPEMDSIVRQMKELAREMNVPVVLCCQLRRAEVEGKRPTLQDLKETGTFEEVADVVMLLHAPNKHKKDADLKPGQDRNQLELILAKQRCGPTGFINLRFDAKLSRFEEDYTR